MVKQVRDGYCVAHAGTWRSSHAVAGAFDLAAALAVAVLFRRFAAPPVVRPLRAAPPALVAHGLFHLGAAVDAGAAGDGWAALARTNAVRLPGLAGFLFAIFRAVDRMPDAHAAWHAAVHATILLVARPPGFAYVRAEFRLCRPLSRSGRGLFWARFL